MLTPADMINIQSAIDGYEKRFPNKPSPSAKEALEWQAGLGQIEFQPNTADRDETGLHGIWYRALQVSTSLAEGREDLWIKRITACCLGSNECSG